MTSNDWIALGALGFSLLGTAALLIIWMVRLEGKTTANALAGKATDKRLDTHIALQDRTHDDLIRVQEQLKHLTTTMQQWMSRPPREREP